MLRRLTGSLVLALALGGPAAAQEAERAAPRAGPEGAAQAAGPALALRAHLGGWTLEVREDLAGERSRVDLSWRGARRWTSGPAFHACVEPAAPGAAARWRRSAGGAEPPAVGDATGAGLLTLVVTASSGGNHGWARSWVLRLDRQGGVDVLAVHEGLGGGARLEDLDGDGTPELVARDEVLLALATCTAAAPFPRVAYRWDGARYVCANDRFPEPGAAAAQAQAAGGRAAAARAGQATDGGATLLASAGLARGQGAAAGAQEAAAPAQEPEAGRAADYADVLDEVAGLVWAGRVEEARAASLRLDPRALDALGYPTREAWWRALGRAVRGSSHWDALRAALPALEALPR